MARKPQFTRSKVTTTVKAALLAVINGSPVLKDYKNASFEFKVEDLNDSKVTKGVVKQCGKGYVPVSVESMVEELYSIPLDKFYEVAEKVSEKDLLVESTETEAG